MKESVSSSGEHQSIVVSRSKLALFLECPKCFYLDRVLGISRIDTYTFSLNLTVDLLLKREFDIYRALAAPHPLMIENDIDAVPFQHASLEEWRNAFKGLRYIHQSGITLTGAPDDLWLHPNGSVSIVDYKATSSDAPFDLNHPHREGYRRQVEVYSWLLSKQGIPVSPFSYFLIANAVRDRSRFDRTLQFSQTIIAYEGRMDWIDDALFALKECLEQDLPPPATNSCEWCRYTNERLNII